MSHDVRCSICGAHGELGCEHGASLYVSKSEYAAIAVRRNPEKSNRALAEELGVSDMTVKRARDEVQHNVAPEKRQGKDGKMYSAKSKVTRRAKAEELGAHSTGANRHIDTRTGENISDREATKRNATAELESEIIELRAEIRNLQYELSLRPSTDDVRRIDAVAHHTQRITTDIDTYNLFRRCLHPDSRNSVSDEILHKAWLAFRNLEPLTYDKSKIPPPLPADLSELFRMKEAAMKKRSEDRKRYRDRGKDLGEPPEVVD